MHKSLVTLFLITLFFLPSCTFHGEGDIMTYTVTPRNFENILTIEGVVEPVRSTTLNSPLYIEGVVAYLIDDGTYVEEGDTVCLIEVQEIQTMFDELSVSKENAEANLSKLRADLDLQYAILEAQVKNNEADTEIAQLDSLQLEYSTPNQRRAKELELQKVAINKKRYEKKLEALKIIQQSEIKRMELEIQRLNNRLQSARETMASLTLKAPRKGLAVRSVNFLTGVKFQVGDPVWSNMAVVSIPEFDEMKIIIQAPERDFKSINVEDSAWYSFDALPEAFASGKIVKKSPVAQPLSHNSKVKFFEIEASVDTASAMPEPGFTAKCHIVLKQIPDTVIVPQISVFEADSMKVVYVKLRKGYEMRQIRTGLTSPKEAIVSEGLRAGEIVALSRPPDGAIRKRTTLPKADIEVHEGAEVKNDSLLHSPPDTTLMLIE